jgi:hypothetical protein
LTRVETFDTPVNPVIRPEPAFVTTPTLTPVPLDAEITPELVTVTTEAELPSTPLAPMIVPVLFKVTPVTPLA